MGKVIFYISMSLDGFVTASGIRPDEPMGPQAGHQPHRRDRAGRRIYDTSLPWC